MNGMYDPIFNRRTSPALPKVVTPKKLKNTNIISGEIAFPVSSGRATVEPRKAERTTYMKIPRTLLFHLQNKEPEKFFGLIEDNIKKVHSLFQTVFKTFLKDKGKIINDLQLSYSNAKLEATNNLIKLIKRNAFGFRNFENFKKRIFIALNIKKERTKFVLSRA